MNSSSQNNFGIMYREYVKMTSTKRTLRVPAGYENRCNIVLVDKFVAVFLVSGDDYFKIVGSI